MKTRQIVIALAILVFAGLVAAWTFGSIVARPHVEAEAPPAPPGQVVHLAAADGVRLTGSYWPGTCARGPAVLLLHGINSSRATISAVPSRPAICSIICGLAAMWLAGRRRSPRPIARASFRSR